MRIITKTPMMHGEMIKRSALFENNSKASNDEDRYDGILKQTWEKSQGKVKRAEDDRSTVSYKEG